MVEHVSCQMEGLLGHARGRSNRRTRERRTRQRHTGRRSPKRKTGHKLPRLQVVFDTILVYPALRETRYRGGATRSMILLDQAGAGASTARIFLPPRMLDPLIEQFWVQQVHASAAEKTWRVIPDPNPYMIFVVFRKESRVQARCALVGPRSCFADVSMTSRVFTCGVRLRPGALPLLTGFPASDFTDRSVPVEAVFGARGTLLMERFGEGCSPSRALDEMAYFFTRQRVNRNGIVRFPLDGCTRVGEWAAQSGLPVRTMHGRMMHHVGFSPKRFLRIERLHHALATSQCRSIAWAQVSAMSGYADQAHMIREFVDLLGESPSAWRSRAPLPICSIRPPQSPIEILPDTVA